MALEVNVDRRGTVDDGNLLALLLGGGVGGPLRSEHLGGGLRRCVDSESGGSRQKYLAGGILEDELSEVRGRGRLVAAIVATVALG